MPEIELKRARDFHKAEEFIELRHGVKLFSFTSPRTGLWRVGGELAAIYQRPIEEVNEYGAVEIRTGTFFGYSNDHQRLMDRFGLGFPRRSKPGAK